MEPPSAQNLKAAELAAMDAIYARVADKYKLAAQHFYLSFSFSLSLTVRPQPVKELLLVYWLVQNNKTELLWLGVTGQDVRWAPMSDQVHGVVKKTGRVRNFGFSCMNSLRCRALLT